MFAELAMAAAGALGGAIATDGWKHIKLNVISLFQHGHTSAATVRDWLEHSESKGAVQELWAARFEGLLNANPDLVNEVQAFIEDVRSGFAASPTHAPITQRAEAHDQAQQAMLGRGIQSVTFGSAGD